MEPNWLATGRLPHVLSLPACATLQAGAVDDRRLSHTRQGRNIRNIRNMAVFVGVLSP
jgi:hypothetical protein